MAQFLNIEQQFVLYEKYNQGNFISVAREGEELAFLVIDEEL